MDMYLNRKLDIVSPEDVRNVFKYKKKKNIVEEVPPLTLDDLLKESKKINETTPDSGLGKDVEISDPIINEQVNEELSDMDIIMSDNENQDDNSRYSKLRIRVCIANYASEHIILKALESFKLTDIFCLNLKNPFICDIPELSKP